MSSLKSYSRAVASSWRNQSPSVRIIRLWLGVTWIYGGWDKATDPNFLAKTGATSITRQLQGYSKSSPLGFLFQHMIERSTLVGVGVMISEFAIGLATLFWVAPTFFAFTGFTMSIGLWLAATWHVKPYFLGSDTAYAVLWLAYLLALIGSRRKIDVSLDKRGTLRLGLLGALAIGATAAGRLLQKTPVSTSAASESIAPSSSSTPGSSQSTLAPNAKKIVESSKLTIGNTHEFTTDSGEPAILFRTAVGVFAYSEICTHQGCTVSYSAPDKALICPCHGASYDPLNGAAVTGGPAPSPLASIKVAEQAGWIIYA